MPDPLLLTVVGQLALAGGYDVIKGTLGRAIRRRPDVASGVRDMVLRDTGAEIDVAKLQEVLDEPRVLDGLLAETSPSDPEWAAMLRGVARGGNLGGEELARAIAHALAVLVDSAGDVARSGASLVESVAVSEQTRQRMAELNRHVDYLTDDQYRIVAQQDYRRVRVSGIAGSGKTLVAVEKAKRLADAGFRTLFLCHNPALAAFVSEVIAHPKVDVRDVGAWIDEINRIARPLGDQAKWTPFDEPTSAELESALDILLDLGTDYAAVIVDEGQDFREEWWMVVEAAIDGSSLAALYIFHDDVQALDPRGGAYPATDVTLRLSRNCRNAGEVYDFMRRLHAGIPRPDPLLEGMGMVKAYAVDRSAVAATVRKALKELELDAPLSTAVITCGSFTFADVVRDGDVVLSVDLRWQWAIRRGFRRIARRDILGFGVPLSEEVDGLLAGLSNGDWPTEVDGWTIRQAARLIMGKLAEPNARRSTVRELDDVVVAALGAQPVTMRGPHLRAAHDAPSLLATDDWLAAIAAPPSVRLVAAGMGTSDRDIGVYTVAQFKGLEADNVVVVWDGASAAPMAEMFVGVSRARSSLVCIVAQEAIVGLSATTRERIERLDPGAP